MLLEQSWLAECSKVMLGVCFNADIHKQFTGLAYSYSNTAMEMAHVQQVQRYSKYLNVDIFE